jgi:hypothetical protein
MANSVASAFLYAVRPRTSFPARAVSSQSRLSCRRLLADSTMRPNTSLEPTAFTPVRLRFGRRLTGASLSRGSVLGR